MKPREIDIPLSVPDDNGHCADILIDALNAHQGIMGAQFDSSRSVLTLRYDPQRASLGKVEAVAKDLGIALGKQFESCTLNVGGLRCDQCGVRLEQSLAGLPGVMRASINPAAGLLGVEYATDGVTTAQIEQHVADRGYTSRLTTADEEPETFWDKHGLAVMTALAGVFLVAGFIAHWMGAPREVEVGLFLLSYLAGGFFAAPQGLRALLSLQLDVDFLMVAAAIGAAIIGHWEEGAILLFLFSLGSALEHYAMERTRNAIRSLMDLSPQEATLLHTDGETHHEEVVPIEKLSLGDIVLVRPGEKVPADGVIAVGQSAIDQAAITGESIPVDKGVGDPVFAGTLNGSGALEVRVTKRAQDSTLSRIIHMVEEARSEKSPTQRFLETYEEKYAWLIVGVTALLIIIPPLLGQPFESSFYRAMTLLVVASPCALVISTPASILSAIANGARNGILFKGGAHLENTGAIKVVAFDKTGTLTHGKPRVTDVAPLDGLAPDKLLALAASVEQLSEHPIAAAIVAEAKGRGLALTKAKDSRSIAGQGIYAQIDGKTVWIGKPALAQTIEVNLNGAVDKLVAEFETHGKTAMVVGMPQPVGVIAVADTIRASAAESVAALKRQGVERVVMVTGDNRRAAQEIAHLAGVDEVHADLLPADKVRVVKELTKKYGNVAVVGDGVNDAPALASANVGVAMGAAGTDVALETADVVLMADDLSKLPYAIALGRQAVRVVKQNLTFALGMIVLLIVSTFLINLPLPLGVVGHEGSTVIVVLNGLRLLRFRPKATPPHAPAGMTG